MEIRYTKTGALTADTMRHLRTAVREVYPDAPASFKPGEGGIRINTELIDSHPAGDRFIVAELRKNDPVPDQLKNALFLDIESHNVGREWDMPLEEFFRLGQYGWGLDGPITVTTDLDDVLAQMYKAPLIVAHQGHAFDFSVMLGDDALTFADDRRLLDTMVYANLVVPAPYSYRDRAGHIFRDAAAPERAKKWLSLDNLCYQFNVGGKEGNLKELAKLHNPKGTKVDDLDYSLIPTDDPDFLAYAEQDIVSLRDLTLSLIRAHAPTEYDWREQLWNGITAQQTRNGWRVDIPVASTRVQELADRKAVLMKQMQEQYGLPVEGKQPWRTTAGKAAIFKVLADNDITPQTVPDWTKTATGNFSLGGDVVKGITRGTSAESLGEGLAELMGQRSLAELALSCTKSDGKVHPEVSSLQRSGRTSVQRPGLTVWSDRAGGGIDKTYFLPDNENESLVEFDYSAADARAVAAYSGDTEFAKRFEEGVDAHNLTGEIFFGHDEFYAHKDTLRPVAKAGGHALSYRVGAKKLSALTSMDLGTVYDMIANYYATYPKVLAWQERVTDEGNTGWITNDWGRKMPVDPDRSYNQSCALLGQSATREILVDGLIKMLHTDRRLIMWLKATVHDAGIWSIPNEHLDWAVPMIEECLQAKFYPAGGQEIWFPVGKGEPARNWKEAGH